MVILILDSHLLHREIFHLRWLQNLRVFFDFKTVSGIVLDWISFDFG
jgi:hypothetical protein